jgi:riboflavin kinase/FMN adenylyltransferase
MTHVSAFGRDRAGTLPVLRQMGERRGWELVEAPTLDSGGARVSSARTRELVASGQLATAATLLGRPFALAGTVVHGERRGRELGFPTANLNFSEPVCLPPDGIYAARASWGGEAILAPQQRADAVISLGTQPTFGGRTRLLEVHLLDREEDLYGQRLRVEFAGWLRGQRRYDSADELIEQMGHDVERARTVLASRAPTASE